MRRRLPIGLGLRLLRWLASWRPNLRSLKRSARFFECRCSASVSWRSPNSTLSLSSLEAVGFRASIISSLVTATNHNNQLKYNKISGEYSVIRRTKKLQTHPTTQSTQHRALFDSSDLGSPTRVSAAGSSTPAQAHRSTTRLRTTAPSL